MTSMKNKMDTLAFSLMCLVVINQAIADEVKILAAEFNSNGNNHWSVNVTLKHADTGWAHYADNWRIIDDKGNVLGDRVLYHPHVDEQPFTRGLSDVKIPEAVTILYIEAHDKVHGWASGQMKVDLKKAIDGRLKIEGE